MAVSVEDQSSSPLTHPIKDKNCQDPVTSNCEIMKTVRKERRKPELQLYRPGRGLQNKHAKPEENSKVTTNGLNVPSCHENNINSSSKTDFKSREKSSNNEKSKNNRNRRPDIQVYTPKAKVAAQLNGKAITSMNDCSSKWGEDENEEIWKNSHCDRHYSSEVKSNKNQNTKREMNGDLSDKNLVLNQLDAPQPTNSWADYPEESDLSNSRSSPENRLCNGYSEDNLLQHSNSAVTCLKNKKSNKEDHRRSRNNKKSHKRNDNLISTSKEVVIEKKCRDSEIGKKNKLDVDPIFQKRNEDSGRRNNRNANGSSNFPAENKNEKKFNTNSLDRGKMKHKESNFNNNERGFISEYNEPSSAQNEIKSEKKKREKLESTLPPRFQKQKAQTSEISSSNQGRGILKIPIEPDPPVENLDNLHISKGFLEAPPMFIHKHLFDPNNPSKPEVVNIPAPVPPPHMPYSKMNPLYYNSDSMSSPYIPAPVETGPYIPPPQPPMINHHYRFLQSDVRPKNIPNFVDIRESSTTLQCPIQPPLLSNVFPTPHGFNEMIPAEPVKKRYKPIVEKNLHEIVLLEREISSLLAKMLIDNNLNTLKQCRWKLQLRYENIILADPKYCAEKNPEQSLWKTVYHQIIETFRKRLEEEQQNSEEIKETLLNIILEGTMFYENLLEKQQETYGFKLAKLLEVEHINTSCLSDQIRCVLISVQKILIYLGDLARYKEQISQTTNYGKARSWYLKAQQIAPKNGKPYHQLALLAFNTKRKLDAVYYYMRSLAASNPFLSAKESLLSLFEEAKRKYEVYEKKRMKENASESNVPEDKTTERCEVWIKNDGSSSERPAELEKNIDSSELKKLSDVELNKRFVTSFLHVHGKLFTKIGMETFPDTLNNMLKEFYFLLQRTPIPLTSSRLLQLLAINIFSVTNSSLKENGREHGGRSLLQEQALYSSMTMMALLMDRCCLLHIAHKSLPEYSNQIMPDDFAQLLPSVKIWTDWMSCQKCLWAPPSSQLLERLNSQFHSDVWSSFADLLSSLQEIDTNNPIIVNQHSANCEPIILEEDSTFAGFVPLLGSIQNPAYAVQPFDKDRSKHCLRISKIQFFGDYLCGISPPYLEFDVESKRFISLVNNLSLEESLERNVLLSSDDSFREEHLNEEISDEIINKTPVSNEFQLLWSRKEALSKAREQQQKYQAQVQAVLQKHQSQRPIVLKIKPRYLVPDTNCFIDHLKLFKNILASTDFHLIIPLVVINELDGLARGTRVNEHISTEHANRVTALSREAILFLEQQFASRHPHLRAITSKGSILDTISFRSEEMGQNKGTNDDLILNCCLNYCKDRAENFMPKNRDEPITLFREVVLLTDDRNLRVKALTHHVPVRDLLSFLQWANS